MSFKAASCTHTVWAAYWISGTNALTITPIRKTVSRRDAFQVQQLEALHVGLGSTRDGGLPLHCWYLQPLGGLALCLYRELCFTCRQFRYREERENLCPLPLLCRGDKLGPGRCIKPVFFLRARHGRIKRVGDEDKIAMQIFYKQFWKPPPQFHLWRKPGFEPRSLQG